MANKKPKEHSFVKEAFDEVPEIGHGWRWHYDTAYNVLWWLIKHKKVTPAPIRTLALQGVNNLIQINELDRLKSWNKVDHYHNVHIPKDEHVTVASVIVVELFTPNEAATLEKYIKKNKWNERTRTATRETNSERLAQARSRNGMSWWRLADIVNTEGYYVPDAHRTKLPDGIEWIQLKAIQVGSGLTAVVARVNFNDAHSKKLDDVWHADHEPYMERSKTMGAFSKLHPVDRQFATYKATQKTRDDLHSLARDWMTKYCPGYFAMHGEKQLSMDVMMTEKYNPVSKSTKRTDNDVHDALRALGIDGSDFYRITAPEIPDMLLAQASRLSESVIDPERTWGLIVNRGKIVKSTENFKGFGGDANHAVSYIAEERVGPTLVLLAISQLLLVLEAQYAKLRDGAQLQHKKFKVGSVNSLSGIVLDSSLTLASIRQDVANLRRHKRWFEGANFVMTPAPIFTAKLKPEEKKPIDFFNDVMDCNDETFKRLSKLDSDYRDILTTISQLGATGTDIKTGRWALAVSALSLIVAIIALYVSYKTGVPPSATGGN